MRFNFFAGASGGKSTMAPWIFSTLKARQYSVEFASEVVKLWAYLNRKPQGFDQVRLLGEQMEREDIPLRTGTKNMVSECPVALGYVYENLYGCPEVAGNILNLAELFDRKYPSVAIFLERGDKPFKAEGRWGTLEDAKRVDGMIKELVCELYTPANRLIVGWDNREAILDFVLENITP